MRESSFGGAANRPTSAYRWVVCGLLFAATLINYSDRQILSLLAPTLQRKIGWSEREYGHIVTAFQAAYAIGYMGFGKLIDVYGTKFGYSLAGVIWSMAASAHALARSVLGFGFARFAMGLGEGCTFPASIKAIAEWFPKEERAFATGLFNSGCNAGGILAPLIVPWLAIRYGWQSCFLALGASGFIWLLFWQMLYRKSNPGRTTAAGGPEGHAGKPTPKDVTIKWTGILGYRQSWVCIVGWALSAPIFWFYLYWTPKFLDYRFGVRLSEVGRPMVTIYALAAVGSIGGGWVASLLMRKGLSLNVARKLTLALCACCTVPVFYVPFVRNADSAVWLIGLAAAGHMGWAANLFTIVSDLFPMSAVASVVGVGGTASAVTAMAFAEYAGSVLERSGSYLQLFEIAAVSYVAALVVMHLLSPRYTPLARDCDRTDRREPRAAIS